MRLRRERPCGEGAGCAGALGDPVLEHKQERGRNEAAVEPRAASCGEPGGERGLAPTLSARDTPLSALEPLAGPTRPPRAHHEPGESERRGRRRPAAVRQLQPGHHVRPSRGRGLERGQRAGRPPQGPSGRCPELRSLVGTMMEMRRYFGRPVESIHYLDPASHKLGPNFVA